MWKSPCAAGMAMSVQIFAPPPDSPKTVTFPGSPPNAAMLSRTHSRAATRSSCAAFPTAYRSLEPAQVGVAEDVQAVIHADEHDILLAHEPVREQRQHARAGGEAAAVDVDHDGPLARQRRRQHVQVQAVLAVDLLGQCLAVRPSASERYGPMSGLRNRLPRRLDAARAGDGRVANAGPRCGFRRRQESRRAFRRAAVRDAAEDEYAVQTDAPRTLPNAVSTTNGTTAVCDDAAAVGVARRPATPASQRHAWKASQRRLRETTCESSVSSSKPQRGG